MRRNKSTRDAMGSTAGAHHLSRLKNKHIIDRVLFDKSTSKSARTQNGSALRRNSECFDKVVVCVPDNDIPPSPELPTLTKKNTRSQ